MQLEGFTCRHGALRLLCSEMKSTATGVTAMDTVANDDAGQPPQHIPLGAELRSRYDSVMDRVAKAAARVGRRPSDIVVVAVTKYASMEQVRELIAFGHEHLGENRVQQLVQRAALVDEQMLRRRERPTAAQDGSTPTVRWHLIGTLQRNKVKKAVEIARLVHSVDSLRLAEEIQDCCQKRTEPVDVLVEVNVSGERSKHGVAPAAARHVVEMIDTMIHLRARGLMCMAPEGQTGALGEAETRRIFTRCHELFEEICTARTGMSANGLRFDILSMGMSDDFEIAIECGANMVRIGSAIFGDHATRELETDSPAND